MRSRSRRTLALTAFLLAAACSGGGRSAPPVSPNSALIVFPDSGFVTNAATVNINGTTSGPNQVTAVAVSGFAATSDDGFLTWEASVPLQVGQNEIVVSLTDDAGLLRTNAASIAVQKAGALLDLPTKIAIELLENLYLVLDQNGQALLSVSPQGGAVDVISSAGKGNGPALVNPVALAYDPDADAIYVADSAETSVVRIDAGTGDRTTVTDATFASAAGLPGIIGAPVEIVVDFQGNLLIADAGSSTVYAVTVATGEIALVSGGSNALFLRGSGPDLIGVTGMALDTGTNRLVVVAQNSSQMLAVDPFTGNRSVVSASFGGPALVNPSGIVIGNGAAFVVDRGDSTTPAALLEVDLATGGRTVLTGGAVGSGPAFAVPEGIAFDAQRNQLLVTEIDSSEVFTVEAAGTARGRRAVLARTGVGSGPPLVGMTGTVLDPERNRLLVTSPPRHLVMAVNLHGGDRTVLAELDPTTLPLDVAFDPDHGRALVLDPTANGRIWAVDLATGGATLFTVLGLAGTQRITLDRVGNRALVLASSPNGDLLLQIDLETGRGPTVTMPRFGTAEIEFDEPGQRLLLVNDNGALIAVDPNTGSLLAVISDARTGTGPALANPRGLVLDPLRGEILVTTTDPTLVVRVDPATGNRIPVAAAVTGLGPRLVDTRGIASAGPRIFVLDEALHAMVVIDRRTGDRLIGSRGGSGGLRN